MDERTTHTDLKDGADPEDGATPTQGSHPLSIEKEQGQTSVLTEEEVRTLIDKVISGDANSFAPIVRNYQHRIYAVVFSQTGDATVAHEVTQQTFIRAYKYLETFKKKSLFSTWLTRIAINRVRSYFTSAEYKKSKIKESYDSTKHESYLEDLNNGRAPEFTESTLLKMREAISELDEKSKEIITLKVFQEMSYKDIAKELNIPVGTVSSRMNTALHKLRFSMKEVCA